MITSNNEVRQLIFGTSQICRLVSNRNIQEVLHCAYDCGIRHFDTARMYGFGEAEGKIGSFLKGHRGACEIATKFGLKFNEPGYFKRKIFLLGRLFKSVFPKASTGVVRAVAPKQHLDFSVDSTRKSVEKSLRSLGVESIDHLFFHEPVAGSNITYDIFSFLEGLIRSGIIKNYGISGSLSEIIKIEKNFLQFVKVKQFASNIRDDYRGSNNSENFCFNVVGAVMKEKMVEDKIKEKKIDKNLFVSALLVDRLEKGRFKKVLFNSNKIETIKSVVGFFVDSKVNHASVIKEVFG